MFNASIEQLNVHSDCVPVCPIRFPCNRQPNIFHPLINSTTLSECSTILCTLLQSGSQTDLKVGWVEEHTTVQLNCISYWKKVLLDTRKVYATCVVVLCHIARHYSVSMLQIVIQCHIATISQCYTIVIQCLTLLHCKADPGHVSGSIDKINLRL